MKTYQAPLVDVAQLNAMSMLMNSPGEKIQGTPTELNSPEMAPKREVF